MENLFTSYPMIVAIVGGLFGMLSHILKKKVRGQSATAVGAYFVKNFKFTLLAIIGMVVAVLMIYDPNMVWYKGLIAYFFAGYGSDSALNKDGGEK